MSFKIGRSERRVSSKCVKKQQGSEARRRRKRREQQVDIQSRPSLEVIVETIADKPLNNNGRGEAGPGVTKKRLERKARSRSAWNRSKQQGQSSFNRCTRRDKARTHQPKVVELPACGLGADGVPKPGHLRHWRWRARMRRQSCFMKAAKLHFAIQHLGRRHCSDRCSTQVNPRQ